MNTKDFPNDVLISVSFVSHFRSLARQLNQGYGFDVFGHGEVPPGVTFRNPQWTMVAGDGIARLRNLWLGLTFGLSHGHLDIYGWASKALGTLGNNLCSEHLCEGLVGLGDALCIRFGEARESLNLLA